MDSPQFPEIDTVGLYTLLGIAKDAELDAIKKSYKTLALRYHPDKNPEDGGEKMKDIASAYAVLSNPDDRKVYDKFGQEGLKRREDVRNELPNIKAFTNKLRLAVVAGWVVFLVLDYFTGLPLEWFSAFLISLGAIYTAPPLTLVLLACDLAFYFLVSTENLPWIATCSLIVGFIGCLNMALLSIDLSVFMLVVAMLVEYFRVPYKIEEWYWTATFLGIHTVSVAVCAIILLLIYFNSIFVLEHPPSRITQVLFNYFSPTASVLPITLILFFAIMWLLDYFTGLPFEWIVTVFYSFLLFLKNCRKLDTFLFSLKVNAANVVLSFGFYYTLPTELLALMANCIFYFFTLYSIYIDESTQQQEEAKSQTEQPLSPSLSPSSSPEQERQDQSVESNHSQGQTTLPAPVKKERIIRESPSYTYLISFLLFMWVDLYGRNRPIAYPYLAAVTVAICLQDILVTELTLRYT